jgi:hypothetical protein
VVRGIRRIATGAVLKDISRDDYTPEGVPCLDKYGQTVLEAAYGLAGDVQWTDADAVKELLRVAGRHHEALEMAEIVSRREGRYLDFPIENRAQRLLNAAATGHPVELPSETDRRRFALVDAFDELPAEEAWQRLAAAVPELEELAEQRKAGTFEAPPELLNRSSPIGVRAAASQAHFGTLRELWVRLDFLLGPRSGQADPLLGSAYARQFALEYLESSPRGPGDGGI